MKPNFPDIQLMYMDTDSFIYHIQTDDIFNDFYHLTNFFDTSDYPRDHRNYSLSNKKVLGKFKDEVNGKIITSYVGLRPKMYALNVDGQIKKRAKGVQRATLEKHISFQDYISVLQNQSTLLSDMRRIVSHDHVVTTDVLRKKSLSFFDDKRFILADGTSTLPHGHFSFEIQ